MSINKGLINVSKKLIFLFVVIVLSLLALLFYIASFNTNHFRNYAEWKEYTNPRFGYSFKYPPDWELEAEPGASEQVIRVKKGPYSLSIYSGESRTFAGNGGRVLKSDQVLVGEKNFERKRYQGLFSIIELTSETKINQILLWYTEGEMDNKNEEIYKTILSYFKFSK